MLREILCKPFQVNEEKTWKDIIAKTNDIGELEGDVRLLRDSQVVNKRLEDRGTEITFAVIYQSFWLGGDRISNSLQHVLVMVKVICNWICPNGK